jgi:hypothetical protein
MPAKASEQVFPLNKNVSWLVGLKVVGLVGIKLNMNSLRYSIPCYNLSGKA